MGLSILAIDPGIHCGFAEVCGDKIGQTGNFLWKTPRQLFLQAQIVLTTIPWTKLLIEGQYHGSNFKAIQGLTRARDGWIFAASWLREFYSFEEVKPSTWQSAVLNIGSPGREVLIEYTKYAASKFTGKLIQSPDEASAICIGAWALGLKI